jgi:hypothetical protein
MEKYRVILVGKASRLTFHETTSFPNALRCASAMGGYILRESDLCFYQDVSLAGEVWNPSLEAVIEYHQESDLISSTVDAMIQAYIDMGDLK